MMVCPRFAIGMRDVVLTYVDATITVSSSPTVAIYLKDFHYPLHLALHYRVPES
jgi:hypothetical protein